MIHLAIILIFCCISCSWNTATVTTSYGQATAIHSISHTKPGDDYNIKTVAVMLDNVEFNLNDHKYETAEDKFNCISAGIKYHLTKSYEWFFVDIGAGFRLTEYDERNKWLADSHLLGDLSFSFGIKKEFEGFNIKLSYTLQHLSVPFRHDPGPNYDVVGVRVEIPF